MVWELLGYRVTVFGCCEVVMEKIYRYTTELHGHSKHVTLNSMIIRVSPSIRMLQLHGVWYSGGSLGLMPWITRSNRSYH